MPTRLEKGLLKTPGHWAPCTASTPGTGIRRDQLRPVAGEIVELPQCGRPSSLEAPPRGSEQLIAARGGMKQDHSIIIVSRPCIIARLAVVCFTNRRRSGRSGRRFLLPPLGGDADRFVHGGDMGVAHEIDRHADLRSTAGR
jgi:hypothetical protein